MGLIFVEFTKLLKNRIESLVLSYLSFNLSATKSASSLIEKAVEYLRKSAELNNPYALNSYAGCFYNGQGVEQNYHKAVKLYEKSASFGNRNSSTKMLLGFKSR